MTPNTWDAKLYDEKHSFVWERAKGVVEMLQPKAGERILDVGCGTGHLTAEIAASGAELVGIDQSPAMIAQARERYPKLKFEVCDAREIPFAGEFDAVFSNAALHWIPEPEKVIRWRRPGPEAQWTVCRGAWRKGQHPPSGGRARRRLRCVWH